MSWEDYVVTVSTVTILLVVAAAYVYVVRSWRRLRAHRATAYTAADAERETKEEAEALTRFTSAILTGITGGTVDNIADAEQVHEGTIGAAEPFTLYLSFDLEFALQRVFAELLLAESRFIPEEYNSDARMELAKKVKLLIEESQLELPFAGVPKTERGLLTDILRFAEAEDVDSVRRRLEELGTAVITRAGDVDQLKRTARMSLWLAFLGFIATVVLGAVTLLS